jgi:hypothetical protein
LFFLFLLVFLQTIQKPKEKGQKDKQYNNQKKKDKSINNTITKRKRTNKTITKKRKKRQKKK